VARWAETQLTSDECAMRKNPSERLGQVEPSRAF
jgi:hypothetical protein